MINTNTASQHFNENWNKYQQALSSNTLHHREMTSALNAFLNQTFTSQPFSLIDLGCGDCSSISDVLSNKPLTQFIGIDAAPDVLTLAENNLSKINCDKEFICADMTTALTSLSSPVDIIYTSYAVHHLPYQEKFDLIQTCHGKLKENGFLLMVDGILTPGQTRDEWLETLERRIQTTQSISDAELALRMEHPRADDFPEEIATFKKIATGQHWQMLDVLVEIDIYAFMVFVK